MASCAIACSFSHTAAAIWVLASAVPAAILAQSLSTALVDLVAGL